MTRLLLALDRKDIRMPGVDLPLLSVSQTRGVMRRSEFAGDEGRADSLDAYKVVRRGEIVFNKMSIRAGALGVAREDGLVTYHYEVMRARPGHEARFLVYLMKSDWFIGELVKRERGIGAGDQTSVRTTEVPFSVLKRIDVWLPTESQQEAIADFLDRETAQIDAVIAKQEELIGLLDERRSAVIAHAVTKGADPEAPVKDSGIGWLGSVPAHWELARLKRRWSVTDCKHITADFVDSPQQSHPLASIREVQCDVVSLSEAKRTTREFFESLREGARDPRPNDLIFSRNATVGAVARVTEDVEPFAMGQDVCLLRCERAERDSSRFLQYALRSEPVVAQMELDMVGSTFRRLNVADIRAFVIVWPPPDEQRRISDALDIKVGQIKDLSAKVHESIALMRERRSALISDAVTGRLDIDTYGRGRPEEGVA